VACGGGVGDDDACEADVCEKIFCYLKGELPMKKNLFCIFAMIMLSLMFLTSCGEEKFSYTASSREFLFEGYVYSINENALLTYRKADGSEENPLCFDPLCEHGNGCPAVTWGRRPDIAVTRNRVGDICVYYTDEVVHFDENMTREYFLYCINMTQGTKTAVFEPQNERIGKFFLYKNDIFVVIQQTTYDENGEAAAYGQNFWRVSADGSDLTQLTNFNELSLNIAAICESAGKTVIYWIDYYDNRTLYASPADFSEKTKLTDNVPMFGNFVVDNMLYYSTDSTITAPALITEALPDDKDKNEDGTRTVYREKKLSAYYKRDLTDPNAEPELVYDGVSSPNLTETPLWTDGEMLYVIPYDPVFIEVIAASREGIMTGDIVEDSLPNGTEIDYIAARSGSKIIEINLATGEKREIPTPGFDPWKIIGVCGGKIALQGYVVDCDRIRAQLEAEGVRSSSFAFEEIQMIDVEE